MRYGLFTTVAAAALSLSVAGAIAQTQNSTGTTSGSSSGETSGTVKMPAQNNTTGNTGGTGGTGAAGGNTAGTSGQNATTTGSTSTTGSINLSAENRTEVTRVFSSVRAEPVSVNFNVAVGTVVPQTVTTLHSCPSDVVRLIKGLPECRYIIVQNKIVLVEPSSRRIVMVLDRQG